MDQELKELLERCKAEERSAQAALYSRFASKVFSTALRYTDSRDEAADIAQESWVKVFRHLAKFTEFNSFEGWVRRITVNTAITHYRRNLKHRYHEDVTETLATPLDLAASKKADFTMDGYSHKEIAEMLGVDINTSKSQLSRGRKQLQGFLLNMARRAQPQPGLPHSDEA
jgi:DNA-directed RNA polymerase specialized sigma24 family protein